MDRSLLERYREPLAGATPPTVRDKRLVMDEDGSIRIYYAPFEYLNHEARIVLVGITPGPTQMQNANLEARRVLLNRGSDEQALKAAKQVGAFSGEPLRTNLVKQLRHWGVHRWLGLHDASELFGSARQFVQTTSLLRYPVFVDGKDYRGSPDMTKHPLLRHYLHTYFAEEVRQLKDALFISLGPAVQRVLEGLVGAGILDGQRIVTGMLHPSGNCTYRINYLLSDRTSKVPHATNVKAYDLGRSAFQRSFLGL